MKLKIKICFSEEEWAEYFGLKWSQKLTAEIKEKTKSSIQYYLHVNIEEILGDSWGSRGILLVGKTTYHPLFKYMDDENPQERLGFAIKVALKKAASAQRQSIAEAEMANHG